MLEINYSYLIIFTVVETGFLLPLGLDISDQTSRDSNCKKLSAIFSDLIYFSCITLSLTCL